MTGTTNPKDISTKLQRIAELASWTPKRAINPLSHNIDIEWLKEAYRRTRKDGAVGVDGQTATDYATNLESNLQTLLDRAKSGRYSAPPVRRVHIPKDDGKTRPLGIPTFEDKVLQRAVVMALEPIYEQDFLDCSYGFRPGRRAHQALESFWQQAMRMGGSWVLEVDIRSFFDTLDHGHLRAILQRRVGDGVVLRLIGKWLNAGVMEDGAIERLEQGTPQGGVISPLLANIYLHQVLDEWFAADVKARLSGQAFLVRYADDFVIGFREEADAVQVQQWLAERFAAHGLQLHPEKTRLVRFERPKDDGPEPGSFDLLGFTHYWGRTRTGGWSIKRKTSSKRLRRAFTRIADWCRKHRHDPIPQQHAMLTKKLRGHYAYYGITGNARALGLVWRATEDLWQKWLSRRSQRARIPWDRFQRLLAVFKLPRPVVVHSVYRAANP
jgi:group II intron reverse transcriptase/maturase